MTTKRLTQWFGANTENAEEPGRLLDGCRFVGIPFAGGMSEVPFIKAKQILVNDLHRHIINLCEVVACDISREWLIREADKLPYHPDALKESQDCASRWPWGNETQSNSAALWYFVCIWMGRGGEGGTPKELTGNLPIRFNAGGGGSNRRYRTAIAALDEWGKAFRRCEFVCMDAFDFIEKCRGKKQQGDRADHGLFVDAPWPDAGAEYTHQFDEGDQRDLKTWLNLFERTRIVVRYGEHPLIRELYPEGRWRWIPMTSRTQANKIKPEFLICNWRED